MELAAEARVQSRSKQKVDQDVEEESDVDEEVLPRAPGLDLHDIGGGDVDKDFADAVDDVSFDQICVHPVQDVKAAIAIGFQTNFLSDMQKKRKLSQADKDLQKVHQQYAPLLAGNFGMHVPTEDIAGLQFPNQWDDFCNLQQITINLKKRSQGDTENNEEIPMDLNPLPPLQPTQMDDPILVPVNEAMKGPAAVARMLLEKAECTQEQIDAVALLASSLQDRFENRPDKSSYLLPVTTALNNHRALWLGGGGVGKTRTLKRVVEPLALTFFGPDGYAATAQANAAAQNLGSKGRTIHSANGLSLQDSLQTARLQPNARALQKLKRLTCSLGVDVTDELGCVPAPLLHADALRKTYGRMSDHNLDSLLYMKPQETWGRMACKILCGDFLQLPPVPASSSLLASPDGQSYEFQQGRKLLADIEHVIDFVEMRRFDDERQVHVLEAMRTPGGKKIKEEAWQAIKDAELKMSGADAHQLGAPDPRLLQARGWYESAYEWRIVSLAMHTHAKLDARHHGKVLYYVPSVDTVLTQLTEAQYEEMRNEPNIGATAKFPGILPLFVGMEVILTESLLPPLLVRGTAGTVVGIEIHTAEASIGTRTSVGDDGCCLLRYLPKCVYVKVPDFEDNYLDKSNPDLKGVVVLKPVKRVWNFTSPTLSKGVAVTRYQIPVLPQKQCTLHGIQGKTAEPGFIAHWSFPRGTKDETKWLATYVSLSRPRNFASLLCHGCPDRKIIEGGPPKEITRAFSELFEKKIEKTKRSCADARKKLGWPARPEVTMSLQKR